MHRKVRISWRTAILFVLVWFLGATILLDLWPLVRNKGEWKTITNTQYGFSVDYPTKWIARTYGEHGFKGGDEIKLRIYRSALGDFLIRIDYMVMPTPTLDDTVAWGQSKIDSSIANIIEQDREPNFTLINLEEMAVNGHPVVRKRYKIRDGIMYESVYIARASDMIIITLQANELDFDSYLEDFDAIVASFRPLE